MAGSPSLAHMRVSSIPLVLNRIELCIGIVTAGSLSVKLAVFYVFVGNPNVGVPYGVLHPTRLTLRKRRSKDRVYNKTKLKCSLRDR